MGTALSTNRQLQLEAWKSVTDNVKPNDYPEYDRPELNSKPNTGMCFNGDGTRTLCLGLGVLAGLRDAGLLQNIRYIGGISGGAWAVILYMYSQLTDNDNIFLGPIIPPEACNMERLNAIHDLCIRKIAANNFGMNNLGLSFDIGLAWQLIITNQLLRPAMIYANKLLSWDEATVDDILLRNKASAGLTTGDFLLPRKYSCPYMIIQWSLQGPGKSLLESPFEEDDHFYHTMEITPLYVGQMKTTPYKHKGKDMVYGGLVESIGMSVNGGATPAKGLTKTEANGFLSMPKPKQMLDMTTVAANSSFVTNAAMKAKYNPIVKSSNNTCDYYSPTDVTPVNQPFTFADGSNNQSHPIISFIQRGVERILSFDSYHHPINYDDLTNLSDENHWKTSKFVYDDYINPNIAALFGIMPVDLNGTPIFKDHTKSHIFQTDDFEDLIHGLKQAYDRGIGAFYRKTFTLVHNRHYGIVGGKRVDITFYFLSKCAAWENRLDPAIKEKINKEHHYIPVERSCYDMSSEVPTRAPEFLNYPHYDNVDKTMLSKAEVNLLCNQVGWTIFNNRDLFSKILAK